MADMEVPDRPQCDPDPIRIIHVGAGASGLLFAYKARKWLQKYSLTCYERNPVPGGTWWVNRYPGCACDIPAHTYTFPFDANPEWSGYYAGADEIQEYMVRFYEKHELQPYMKFNTEVTDATWDEAAKVWRVGLRQSDGSRFEDTCDVFVNGTGVLSRWKWPDIEGLQDFKGELAHSADWDRNLKWEGKKVAVIGTGSSSIQMTPVLADTAKHLTVFMRNETYIGPPFASDIDNKEADSESQNPDAPGHHLYTEKEKQRFRDDPDYLEKYRRRIEQRVVGGFSMFYRGSELNLTAKAAMQNLMRTRLGDRDDLKELIIPSWSPGCRRLTPGEGFLEALTRPNVTTVHTGIQRFTPNGILTADGNEHPFDFIACATGFDVQYQPHFPIYGRGGEHMQSSAEPNVYAAVAVPRFPNYFVVNGPRGQWAQGSILPSHDVQIEYILQVVRHMQEDQIASVEPREDLTDQLNRYMDTWHKKHSIWAEDCRSWYKDNKPDGRIHVWSGSMLHHLKYMKTPRFEHYVVQWKDPENVFRFLGHGMTIGEMKYGADVPVPYIRKEDTPWDVE
ncbi:FAD/NAD(P)-binding domain-containing protein [Eremomyces bilateralis CBS 781.70]|uniref:FAD/NAD(P)-binding domain-containing protein n=1 Tax=Eremomyces bilateralis CBS 781.70 TaxID=1392243 RepID=A0A6G1G0X0_9PEZI|nr:FAD/NAD(P)-binding domain-containing protein [Eremomyces bilateralis CBS 781.70]KAF1811757.1 FAD/NAD(P)-binding domain-containing protein [Eremomyces bilateralis CBS 781.70]